MDLGGFFSDLFSGRLFAPKKKKEEQPQTVSVQKPTVSTSPSSPLQPAGIKMPGSLVQEPQTPQFQAPSLGGVSQAGATVAPRLKPTLTAPSLVNKVGNVPSVNSINSLTPNYKPPVDRYAGLSGEDANIAKNLEAKGKNTDAFITSARESRALKEKSDYQNSFLGKTLNTLGGVGGTVISSPVSMGESLGTGLASYSPEVRALEAQQKANPENPYLAAGLQDIYSGIQEKTNPETVIMNSVGLLLDVLTGSLTGKAAGTVVGKGINLAVDPLSILNKIPADSFFGKILNKEIGSNLNNIPQVVDNMVPNTNKVVDTEMVGPNKEIGSSITSVAPSSKAPAVTSPAQEAAIAAQSQPTIAPQIVQNMPTNVGGVKTPEIVQAPKLTVPKPVTSLDVAQKNIDEIAVKAPEAPVAPIVNELEAPNAAASKAIAETTTPVSETAVNASNVAEAVNKAPTEAIAQEVAQNRLKADDEVDAILKQADETFGGGSYGDLVVKQASNSDKTKPNIPLTPAEKALNDRIKPQLDAVRKKLNDLGLTDEDLGFISYRSDYLPTGKKDNLSSINSTDDVARMDFNFAKKREGKMTDAEIKEGGEQALRDYLRVGELADNLTPEQVKAIKLARKNDETNKLFEQDRNGGSTGLKMTDPEIKQSQIQTEKMVDAEAAKAVAEKKVAEGDTSPATLAERDRTQQQASDAAIEKKVDDYVLLRKKTEDRIAQIKKDDTINPDSKKQQITQLRSHLADVRNDTYYMQSTVRTNLLLGVGRIADQVNKGIQSVSDAVTGIASKIGANKSFNKVTGRDLYADKTISNEVYKNVQSNPLLNRARIERQTNSLVTDRLTENKGPVSKFFGKYNQVGTNVTNAGSRYKVVDKDTASFFTSEAQANGITDVKGITDYVTSKIGTKEWNRTRDVFFDARNSFTGIPTKGSVTNKNVQVRTKTAIYDKLGDATNLSEGTRENIADAVTIPIMGFPKLLARLGLKGFDISTWGARDLWKANKIKPQNDADALKKALYVQSAIRNVQSGVGLGVLGMSAGAAGMVTGAYPEDANEKARWQKDKIQPYSLKVGDTYIELGRYAGPLAFPFMIGATLGSKGGSGNIPEVSAAVMSQMLSNFGADSMGDVMVDAGELLNGKKNVGDLFEKYGAGIADAFVPGASLLNTTGKAQDIIQGNAQPDTSAGFVDKFRSKFPFLRDGLPGKTDTLGNPISQGGPATLLPGISGGQSSNRAKTDERQDSVMSEIDRLAKLGYETMPAKDIKNKNSQVDAKALQATKIYQEASDDVKAEYLKETLLGTKTKNINSGLSESQRTALIEHAIMPTDKRDVWLEDNDNAVNYYSANYDNLKANKTLTAKDENLEYKTGALYLKKKAEVNKSFGADTNLQQLYDKITLAEWRAMLDPESEDQDLATAEKLMAYDKARTEAGVSGKDANSSKPKYTEKTAGKGKGGKDFAFASMPSSLIGSSGASKGYADNAPTFKPIADLQAPTGAQIPKGRTISIKKGINL